MRASLAIVLALVGCQSPTRDKDRPAQAASGSAGSAGSAGSTESAARADEPAAARTDEGAKPATLAWGPERATTIAIGPFSAPIPKGWRDTAELVDQQLVAGLPEHARGLMPETSTSTEFRSNIVLQWTAVHDSDLPCQAIADATKGQSPLVPVAIQTIKLDGDRGCRWDVEAPAAKGTQLLRFHGDHLLLVQVLHARAGDPGAVAAFDQVLAGLRKK